MLPIVQIGPLAVQVPGLVLLLGVWVGLSLAEGEARRLGTLSGDAVYNLALAGLVAGVLGARLVYATRYLSAYLADPLSLLSPNPATLAPAEGALIGLLAAFVYGQRRQLPLRPVLDALAPGLAVMAVALALAHLASGDAFGAPASVPWRIYLWDDYRHPSQVYELAAAGVVLAVWGASRARLPGGLGLRFVLVAALLAGARVFLEAFRGDSLLAAGGLRTAQLWGMAVLAVCLWLWPRWRRQGAAPPEPRFSGQGPE